ncbi:hypothetical protein BKA70DRAFT_1436089 [Coprinopsis sp. MPI-PUGE-AT-0042]|nr:hypothetical protein BKA70DRAFT_1436089 [Coprinopsis sp. MPI-PUGE-AT-0042]
MSALSAAGAGEAGSPEISPVPERKNSYGESPRGSMVRERVRVDGGIVHSQRLPSQAGLRCKRVHAGSRTSVQPQTGFGKRSRLEDLERIPKEKNARLSLVTAAGAYVCHLHSQHTVSARCPPPNPQPSFIPFHRRFDSSLSSQFQHHDVRGRSRGQIPPEFNTPPIASSHAHILECSSRRFQTQYRLCLFRRSHHYHEGFFQQPRLIHLDIIQQLCLGSNERFTLITCNTGLPTLLPLFLNGCRNETGLSSAVGAGGLGSLRLS